MRRKTVLAAGVALVLVSFPAAAWGQASDGAFAQRVDSVANAVLKATGVPSASVAVVREGRLAYAHAYGSAHLEPPAAATTDMRYAIGSISKQFTAATVLLLQQQGKLSLDDPVSRWYPGLTRAKDVTLREILSHTSGYQDFWPQDYVPPMMNRDIEPDSILARWAGKPLDFEPGTRWQYSNTNFVLAARIVEKVTGEPFFRFLSEHVLQPLNMSSAVNFDAKKLTTGAPTGYMRYGLGPLRQAPDEGSGWMFGAGELAMTPSDLARWDIAMIHESLLDPASYEAMETEVLLKNGVGTGYGLGVDVGMQAGHRLISHSGEVSGFTAYNLVFPDDSDAVIVLTNQDAAPAAGAIARGVSALLFATVDAESAQHTARALAIFRGLQNGTLDRSLFTADANAYFSEQALSDFQSSLGPLGEPTSFVMTGQSSRGGMVERSYVATFPHQQLRVWTYAMPDGKLEQYQVAPRG